MGELIKLYDKKEYGDAHAMTCAQFAYYCYKQAGEQYRLKINRNYNTPNLLEYVKLYIKVNQVAQENNYAQSKFLKEDFSQQDKEQLLEATYTELANGNSDGNENGVTQLSKPLVEAICGFLKQLAVTFGIITKDKIEAMSMSDMIELISDNEEYFISPGDLMENCENLELLGILED